MVKKMLKQMFSPFWVGLAVALVIFNSAGTAAVAATPWQIGTPITTYFCGPGWYNDVLTDTQAQQIADGNFNLTWSHGSTLDIAQAKGLRATFFELTIANQTDLMSDPVKVSSLDGVMESVKNETAMYNYYIWDEPPVWMFPELGALTAYMRLHDPAHPAYINLFGLLSSELSWLLGVEYHDGWTPSQYYQEYLAQFISQVNPAMLSYDLYPFRWNPVTETQYDDPRYFQNLALVREAAVAAHSYVGIPFMNILDSVVIDSTFYAPDEGEMRWNNYTSLAYGAQGISYFVYRHPVWYNAAVDRGEAPSQMVDPDYNTTATYGYATDLNQQFVAVATALQHLRSLAVYRVAGTGTPPDGLVALPGGSPFYVNGTIPAPGILLGYFGNNNEVTHALMVNMDHDNACTVTINGPRNLYWFNTGTGGFVDNGSSSRSVYLPAGCGLLVKVFPAATSVRVTSPYSGESIVGNSLNLAANTEAASGITIAHVNFYAYNATYGSIFIGSDTTPDAYNNWGVTWSGAPYDTFGIWADAYDTNENYVAYSGSISPVTFVNSPAAVSITTPSSGDIIGDSVHIIASATGENGCSISRVDFYMYAPAYGSVLIASDTNATDGWSCDWNGAPQHVAFAIYAMAYDVNSNEAFSGNVSPVTFTHDAPVCSITSPVNGTNIIGNSVNITATASENGGSISRVDFYLYNAHYGSVLIASDTNGADGWSCTWNGAPYETFALYANAYDAHGDYAFSGNVNPVSFWNTADINASGGSASYNSGTFTVAGKGAGITGTADGFRFLWQELLASGNWTLTAKVNTVTGTTSANSRVGVMMRQSTASGAIEASSLYKPSSTIGVWFHRRLSLGGTTSTTYWNGSTCKWVRVTRSGNTLSAWRSTNGTSWTQVGSNTTVTMTGTIDVGLAVTSGNTSNTNTVTISDVTITQP